MKTYSILKVYCRFIFFLGSGDFWYEQGVLGNDGSVLYHLFQVLLLSTYVLMTIFEIIAAIYGDFPKDEMSDCVTFAMSHTIVLLKTFSVIKNKLLIRQLNKKMINICQEYEKPTIMMEKYRIIKINVIAYFISVYGCVLFFIFEGLRKMYAGSHFVTVVTYYPSFEDDSVAATGVRIFTTVVLGMMMMTMIVSVDSFTMVYLIMFKYKIITLRHYIENLRVEFDRARKINLSLATKDLRDGLVKGIVMHSELLRICKEIDKAFGTVIALQLCLSSGSAVSLLLKIALSRDLTFMAIMKIIFFVAALFFLLALFLCNAGEITYQASLLSDAIFYCGWHACDRRGKLGRIVLLSVARAQRPLVMKAFKMIQLTYATFLWVVRSTYSIFALFYAQNK